MLLDLKEEGVPMPRLVCELWALLLVVVVPSGASLEAQMDLRSPSKEGAGTLRE
jgi:hypothetical protein